MTLKAKELYSPIAHIFDRLNESVVGERKMRGSGSYPAVWNSLVLIHEAGEVMAYRPEIPGFHGPVVAELALDIEQVLHGISRVVVGVVRVGVRGRDMYQCATGCRKGIGIGEIRFAGGGEVRIAGGKIAGHIEVRGIGVILAVEDSEAGANHGLGIERIGDAEAGREVFIARLHERPQGANIPDKLNKLRGNSFNRKSRGQMFNDPHSELHLDDDLSDDLSLNLKLKIDTTETENQDINSGILNKISHNLEAIKKSSNMQDEDSNQFDDQETSDDSKFADLELNEQLDEEYLKKVFSTFQINRRDINSIALDYELIMKSDLFVKSSEDKTLMFDSSINTELDVYKFEHPGNTALSTHVKSSPDQILDFQTKEMFFLNFIRFFNRFRKIV